MKTKRIGGRSHLVCSSCKFVFFQNSKPCAGGLIFHGKEILLTKRAIEPHKGSWDIPGGFLEKGEDPVSGLKRELLEELGLRCQVGEVFKIITDDYGDTGEATLNIFYFVKPAGKIGKAADDVSEFRFFPLDSLPRNVGFACVRKVLRFLARIYTA